MSIADTEVSLKRARDFALYIVVGLAIVLAILWYASRGERGGSELIGKWAGLAGTTVILFGYAIRSHKGCLQRLSFWLVTLALLVVHLSVFIAILERVEHWKVIWFVFAYPVENIAISVALSLTGRDGMRRGERRPVS